MLNIYYKNKLIEFLQDKVKFAYIFGSAITEYFTEDSDIDLAVWLEKVFLPQELIDFKYQMEKYIDFSYEIDLVILNSADIIISYQVIKNGELIINNDPDFTLYFVISRISMYMDFKLFRKGLEDNLKTPIL